MKWVAVFVVGTVFGCVCGAVVEHFRGWVNVEFCHQKLSQANAGLENCVEILESIKEEDFRCALSAALAR